MKKTLFVLLTLLTLVSCGESSDGGHTVTPVEIIGSTYYPKGTNDFSSLSISGSRELGQTLTVTFNDFVIADGVEVDCVISGQVNLSNTYNTNFTAGIVASGDTAIDVACSNAFSGYTSISAGDDFLRYNGIESSYKLTL